VEEFLIEGSDRLGGLIRTEPVEGFVVESGPDSFLAEKPEAEALCRELGLARSLIGSNPATRRTYILHQGRLVPLPDGLQLFAPTQIWPVLTTPLLPVSTKLTILAQWLRLWRPRNRSFQEAADDETVAGFVRRHFGSGMLENIADPLLAGILGGDSALLSVRSVLPRLHQMEQKYGGLLSAVRDAKRRGRQDTRPAGAREDVTRPSEPVPLFMTLKAGLGEMVEGLASRLESSRVFCGKRILRIDPINPGSGPLAFHGRHGKNTGNDTSSGKYQIRCEGGLSFEADALIVALPAHEGGRRLVELDSALAANLSAIPHSSAVTVALGYGSEAGVRLPPGFGFLVPRQEKWRLRACTFVQGKFPHRTPPGGTLLRAFLGGVRDPEVLELDDSQIVSIIRRELQAILGLSASPLFSRIYRWPSSMLQYVTGHHERVKTIQRQLENHTGLFLAGNAFSGVGISDCIRSARAAAEAALSAEL